MSRKRKTVTKKKKARVTPKKTQKKKAPQKPSGLFPGMLFEIARRAQHLPILQYVLQRKKGGITSNIQTLLIIVGILLITFPYIQSNIRKNKTTNENALVENTHDTDALQKQYGSIQISSEFTQPEILHETPLRIVIPTQHIDIPIVEAPIVNGYWELSETTASHGLGSAHPGEIGNMVIFAHAREGLFLPLRDMKRDENIYVLTKEKWYRYSVKDIQEVSPEQIEVIQPSNDERLTLFTCSGFFDEKRIIIHATPYYP